MLKKVLDSIVGDSLVFSLEKRIFHSAVISYSFITVIQIVWAVIHLYSPLMTMAIIFSLLIFIMLYILSIASPKRGWPIWGYVLINFVLILFLTHHLDGRSPVIFSMLLLIAFLLPQITTRKHTLFIVITFIVFYALWLSFFHYVFISSELKFYRHEEMQNIIMQVSTITIFMFIVSLMIKKSFKQEQEKVLNLNKSLQSTNNEIKIRNNVLNQLDEAKNQFFRIIAHDLRGPIGAIHGLNKVLLSDYSHMNKKELEQFLNSLTEASKNTYRLIDNLLSWSKAADGDIKAEKVNFDIKEVFDEVIQLLSPQYFKKNVKLLTETDSVNIHSDMNIMRTVLRNLLSNALKYTPEGKEVKLKSEVVDKKLIINISDEGVGMNKNTLEGLFHIDKVYSREGTKNEKGSGLGLILCFQLLDKINAEIKAESKVNEGSVFTVELPLN